MIKLPRFSLLSQICLTHLISHIHMLVLPVLMPIMLLQNSDISFVQIGIAISVFNIVSAAVQAPIGIFVDRIGPKRVLLGGLILGSLSFLSLGFIHNYIWLVIAMGLAGIANAVYHPADYAIMSQNVRENRMGRAFSLHTFSGSIGFAITPTLMLFISNSAGISMAFIVSGLLGLFVAVLLLPKAKDQISKDNSTEQSLRPHKKNHIAGNKYLLMSPAVLVMFILFFLLNFSGGSIQYFSVSALVMGYNITLADANIALTAFLVTGAVGVLVGGILADYSKHHGLIAAGALVITALPALVLAIFPITSTFIVVFLIGLIGFLSGLIMPSRDMLVKNVSPKGQEGKVFGVVFTGFNLGGTVSPILFAWILDHKWPQGIFWSTAIFMIVIAILAFYQEVKRPTDVNIK